MNILIIGGGGVVGQKLGRALAAKGELRGQGISKITLADINDPAPVDGGAVPVGIRRLCERERGKERKGEKCERSSNHGEPLMTDDF